jgi:poly(3-hydroxybutyrate) depolymerase
MTKLTLDPPEGRSTLPFVDARHPDRPLAVNCYRPAAHRPDDEVVVVQHGMMRNGDDYRDFWIEAAEKHNVLIVAPTFGNEHFPKAEGYNNGLVIGADGNVSPSADWLYCLPARVVAALRAAGVTRRERVKLFGHSAGGQFVHRLLATQDHAPFEAATAANSGWYTLPSLETRFPEGLAGLNLDDGALARWLAFPMVILAGDRDTNTSDPNLPAQPEALRQGTMRYARAHFMLDFARREAARRSLVVSWRLVSAPGIGHDGAAMSRAAAGLWFEGTLPPANNLVGPEISVA